MGIFEEGDLTVFYFKSVFLLKTIPKYPNATYPSRKTFDSGPPSLAILRPSDT